MVNKALAKTKNEETIIDHTEELLKNYNILKDIYPDIKNLNWEILKLACIYHDLGKLNTKFQNKLMEKLGYDILEDTLKNISEIPHGYLSPAFLDFKALKKVFDKDEITILVQSIYYHHNREKLENPNNLKKVIIEDLSRYTDFYYDRIGKIYELNNKYWRYVSNRLPNFEAYEDEDVEDEEISLEEIEEKRIKTNKEFIMTKGLLNKIDYAASSGVDIEFLNNELEEKTYDFFNKLKSQPNKLQKFMESNKEKNIVAIASTGIGKTEGALLWIGNNKGFFTLPLRVSLNAIYDRLKDKIKFTDNKLGLLHSEAASEYMKKHDGELDRESLDEIKQFSKALTVCTLDQLLDFVFKTEGFELKLATLSYSKLIIDEIQMYSPDMLGYLLKGLQMINGMGGRFAIVTATFPPILKVFMKELNIDFEEAAEPFLKENSDGTTFERHRMKVLNEKININHIKENYESKRVLVIVNTVKEAQRIYDELINESIPNINIFHSKYIKKDRSAIESEILEAGKVENGIPANPEQVIWVTTQVVEASLDIDFDVLYTELSDLSGLFQRMGRVYRNRPMDENINIYVYTGGNGDPSGIRKSEQSIIDYDIYKTSRDAIESFGSGPIKEIDKMNLINNYFTYEKLGNSQYYKKVINTISYISKLKSYEVEKKDVKLRDILTVTIIPKCVYDENKEDIERNIQISMEEKTSYEDRIKSRDKIMQYTLAIPQYEYDFAKNHGLIYNDDLQISKYQKLTIIKFPYDRQGLRKPKNEDADDSECLFV